MGKGIEIESETLGNERGRMARRGDTVTIRYQLFLNHGELVRQGEETFTLGRRHMIAGLEYGVEGMLVGGTRRFRVGPHLAYRDTGVPGTILPHAVLIFEVELLQVHDADPPRPRGSPAGNARRSRGRDRWANCWTRGLSTTPIHASEFCIVSRRNFTCLNSYWPKRASQSAMA